MSFRYDAANRVTQTTLPDGESVGFSFDSNSNVTAIKHPGRPAHLFTYTPSNRLATYQLSPGQDSL